MLVGEQGFLHSWFCHGIFAEVKIEPGKRAKASWLETGLGIGQFEGFASPGFVTVAEKSHTEFVIDVLIGLPGRIEPEGLFVVAQRLGKNRRAHHGWWPCRFTGRVCLEQFLRALYIVRWLPGTSNALAGVRLRHVTGIEVRIGGLAGRRNGGKVWL